MALVSSSTSTLAYSSDASVASSATWLAGFGGVAVAAAFLSSTAASAALALAFCFFFCFFDLGKMCLKSSEFIPSLSKAISPVFTISNASI